MTRLYSIRDAGLRRRHGLRMFFYLGALAATLVLLPGLASASLPNPPLFELDGNATTNHATAGVPDDWDRIYCAQSFASCATSPGAPSDATSDFIPSTVEGPAADTTYFKGSATDSDPTPQGCGGSAPSKDEIDDAFAAAYIDPSDGHTIVYFGGDRDSNNGDAEMGFWFNGAGTVASPGVGNNGCAFTGVHQNGDLLILSNFTNGGTVSSVTTYQWAGGPTGGPVQITAGNGAACTTPIGSGVDACGIANAATISSAWPYPPGATSGGSIPANGFFEGGVDLSAIFASVTQAVPCFDTFYGETRSSASFGSTLKDFAFGDLDTCGSIELKKQWVGPASSTTLKIGTTAGGGDVASKTVTTNDTTGPQTVAPGTYFVSESLPPSSAPGGYTETLACVNNKTGTPVTVTPGTNNSIPLTTGDAIVCTYTNTYILASPTIATTANPSSTTIVAGGVNLSDTATLAGGISPTGTISFKLYSDASCTTQVGTTQTATVSGNGNYSSPAINVTSAGTYHWVASYGGDSQNNPVSGTCGATGENVTVNPAAPGLTTQASATATVPANLTDTATLSGGDAPTGTITFHLYSNNTCTAEVAGSPVTKTVTGNGAYTSSPAITVSTAGTYYWRDSYNGDGNNSAIALTGCNAANESTLVRPASPTLATQASPTATVPAGLTDTATLSGGFNPTGTITFHLYSDASCSTQVAGSPVTATVSGNGAYPSPAITVSAAGTYYWRDSYGGDGNNAAIALTGCNAANESTLVNPASPGLTTQASPTATVPAGLTDTATLSGGFNPTGTITFHLYSDASCSTEVSGSPVTKTVSGNSDYTSPAISVSAAGTYFWRDSYGGDTNNAAIALTGCNAANESTLVNPASPGLTTQASPATTVPAGLTDTATLSGGFNPTGTITFHLYSNASCTTEVAGSPVTAPVSGNAMYTSPAITVSTAGTYYWRDSYNGDGNNSAIALTGCNAANESTLVNPASPGLTTQASPAAIVPAGLTDTADLTGGFNPTGSITFKLYSNSTCTTQVGTTQTVTVTGDGMYLSPSITVNSAGTYYWVDSYSGDTNNNPIAPTACNAANESTLVSSASPSLTTASSPAAIVPAGLTDTATLSGGFEPTGTITFKLYSDASCTTQVGTTQTVTVTGDGMFTSPAIDVTSPKTYYWVDTYSGDTNNNGFGPTTCGATGESTLVSPGTPELTTQASPAASVPANLTDTATLTGGDAPTGSISFTLYSNATCTTQVGTTQTVTVTGDGVYTSPSIPVTLTGTYYWVDTYSGDTNNDQVGPTTCGIPSETTTVGAVSPTLTTTASAAAIVPANLSDAATLAGGDDPTGSIVFKLYSDPGCTTQVGSTQTVTVTGNGVYTSPAIPVTSTGTYFWVDAYSGDINNNGFGPTACGATGESTLVSPASPSLTTTASAASIVPGTLSDEATLTGGFDPSGSITFKLYSDATCTTQVGTTQTVTVTGDGTYTSPSIPATSTGTYHWVDTYTGDPNNNSFGPTDCGATGENTLVSPASPSLSTTASPAATVPSDLTDTATLTGGFNPTGTISFTLYSDASCTTQVGTTQTVPVSNDGMFTSPSIHVIAAGTYYWVDTYSGDTNNNGFGPTACGATGESTVVSPATPSLSTTASAPATVPADLSDMADLTGGFDPTGMITFTLYSDAGCTTQVGTTQTVPVSGNGIYTSPSIPVTSAGTYYWADSYSGDPNNVGFGPTACGATGESTVVGPASPDLTTTAAAGGAVPADLTDTAHLTGGFNPTGSITFDLYFSDNTCGEGSLVGSVSTPVSGSPADYVSPSIHVTTAGTYYWRASYSGDANNNPVPLTDCNVEAETTTVGQVTPTTTTTLHDAAGGTAIDNGTALDLGSGVYDVANVSSTDGLPFTGTVTFTFFGNGNCTGPASPDEIETGVAVDDSGNATSSSHLGLPAGDYSFDAQYIAGDDPNHTDSTVSSCEPFSINQATPGLTTAVLPSTTIALGTAVSDSATLSGKVGSLAFGDGTTNPPTGATVSYQFFANGTCAPGEGEPMSSQSVTVQSGRLGAQLRLADAGGRQLLVPRGLQRQQQLHVADRRVRAVRGQQGGTHADDHGEGCEREHGHERGSRSGFRSRARHVGARRLRRHLHAR